MNIKKMTDEELHERFRVLALYCDVLAQEEAPVLLSIIGTTIDHWCFVHGEDPAEVLEILSELSKDVNEAMPLDGSSF